MSITVGLYVETQGAYDKLRLYRDSTPGGDFSTLVEEVTLVAGTTDYTVDDAAGTVASWYRYTLYDVGGATETAQSEAFRPLGLGLLTVRLEAAQRCGAGFSSVCTATGAVGYLVDVKLLDTYQDSKALNGAWIYRPNGTAADKLRRVASGGLNVSNGRLTPARDWDVAPASAEVYQVFLLLCPADWPGQAYTWDMAVRDGLDATEYVDRITIATGDGTTDLFSLTTHLGYLKRGDIRAVYLTYLRDTVTVEIDADKLGRYWEPVEDGEFNLSIRLYPPPPDGYSVVVECDRRYEAIYRDADITTCPAKLAALAARWKAYAFLDHVQHRYKQELSEAYQEYLDELGGNTPESTVRQ